MRKMRRAVVLELYRAERKHHYGIEYTPSRDLPDEDGWQSIILAIEALGTRYPLPGENAGETFVRVAGRALRFWIVHREGRKNFLVNEKHPLFRLPQDLGWLQSEMVALHEREARMPAAAAPAPAATAQDLARTIAEERAKLGLPSKVAA